MIDTLGLARDKYPVSSANLDSLFKRFKIDNSKRVKHSALIDCELLAKVYINIIDQKEPTLDFQVQNLDQKEKNSLSVSYYKKVIKPTKEEIKLHEQYLKNNLKKNHFN